MLATRWASCPGVVAILEALGCASLWCGVDELMHNGLMSPSERRKYVRVVPRADLPLRARIPGRGVLQPPVTVLDVSVGGMAVSRAGAFARVEAGARLRLELTFARFGTHEVEVEVRRVDAFVVGLQFVDVSSEVVATATRYVSELLERGAAV